MFAGSPIDSVLVPHLHLGPGTDGSERVREIGSQI